MRKCSWASGCLRPEAPLPQRDTVERGHEFDAPGCRHECDSGIILVEPDSEGPTGNDHWGLGCLARLRNTRNPIVVPRECIEQDLNNRITSDSRESEIKTRMPGTSDPSDPSCSSRCHLADEATCTICAQRAHRHLSPRIYM